MRFWISSMALGFLVGLPIPARAQTAEIQKEVQDKLTEKKKLEDLLSLALKNNPDLRVAQAKLQEAEAELNRVLLQVSRKVVILNRNIALAQQAVKAAGDHFESVKKLRQSAAISQEDFRAEELKYQKAKAELAIQEAELPFVLGSGPTLPGVGVSPTQAFEASINLIKRSEKRVHPSAIYSQVPSKEPKRVILSADMEEKLRKALDTKVKVEFTGVPPKEVLEFLQDKAGGFNVIDQLRGDPLKDLPPVTLSLREPVPVGAVFQYLQDKYLWHFVIRDYGVVVTETEPPAGAVDVIEFWKNPLAPKEAP